MNTSEFFKTTSLNLTTFLVVKDYNLIKILNGSKRKTFVFKDSSELRELVRIFHFGGDNDPGLMVNSRKILQTLRDIKSKLYSNVANKEE